MNDSNIPIQNIYYMLSYAYERLKINNTILKESVDFKNIYDLFARILINVVNRLIKRGFYKEYVLVNRDVSSPKGKINISESIKRRTFLDNQLNCQFDEFNDNVLFNQIIKTTIDFLVRVHDLDKNLKNDLKKFKPFFSDVDDIELNRHVFKSLIWNRNNKYYNVAISVCELIFLYKLPDDSLKGEIAFKDFVRDYEKEFAKLFEQFIFNFFKREFKDIKTYSPKFSWNIDEEFNNKGVEYLPNMRSDIVLERNDKQLIIDTKFYKSIFSNYYDSSKLHSGNLYQLLTYVNSSNFQGSIKGLLLYASLGDDINYQYKIKDKVIYIKTLDLNQNWEEIDLNLKKIASLLD